MSTTTATATSFPLTKPTESAKRIIYIDFLPAQVTAMNFEPLATYGGGPLEVDPEAWLLKNKSALESVRRGMEQAKRGELVDRGSFADHADDEIE